MKKAKSSFGILCYFLFAGVGMCITHDSMAQSKVDSIILEVEALNKQYHQRLKELYNEMYDAQHDSTLKVSERIKARLQYHLFPIEETMNWLLDNIDKRGVSFNDDFNEEHPYWANFGKMIYQNEYVHPALMRKVMDRLDKPQSTERLYWFSFYFENFFYLISEGFMDKKEKAACLRIMANSIRGVSQRKENLLRIADILENK